MRCVQFQGLLPLVTVLQAQSKGASVTAMCVVPMLEVLVTCSSHDRNVRCDKTTPPSSDAGQEGVCT